MRAVIADRPGPPAVLRPVDVPDPEPGPGQVLIAVQVAAITFIDTQLRAGTSPRPNVAFPLVIGNGVGGIVDAVGADVDPVWIGTAVVSATGGSGGYATRAVAEEANLHRLPAGLELQSAVALLADGRTAVGLARAAEIGSGDNVVVTAAAGGVGSLLVQLAAANGARVIALAGSRRKLEHARSLGADVAINYRDADWAARLARHAPDGVDVVFDGVGGDTSPALFALVQAGGRYLPHGAASGTLPKIDEQQAASRGITIVPLSAIGRGPAENAALIDDAFALAASGAIHPTIGQTFPLDNAADAHAAIENRSAIGKTLLVTPEPSGRQSP